MLRWPIPCTVLLAALGCTRVTELGGGDNPSQDYDAPHSETNAPDSGEMSDTPGFTNLDTVCLPASAPGYRLPSARWALAALFASRRLSEVDGTTLHLSPAWFLTAAWQTDAFACGGYGSPWADDATTDPGGCYDLQPGTHWVELQRLFPERFAEEGWPDWVTGDTPERSTLALAHAVYAGHLLLRRIDGTDPDARVATVDDPAGTTRLATFFHAEGPWSATASRALTTCSDDLRACAQHGLLHHLDGQEAKLDTLADADCFDTPLTDADLVGFADGLAALWPAVDPADLRAAARSATTGTGFAVDGLAVVRAVEATIDAPLTCPADTLWDHYRYSCD